MQTDAEPRILTRQSNSLLESRLIHHQAGGGKNPFAMRADDGVVRAGAQAEVVGIHNQPPLFRGTFAGSYLHRRCKSFRLSTTVRAKDFLPCASSPDN